MAGPKVPIMFRIFKGDTFIREATLSQPVIKVGKLSSSHLRLEDDTVSRMHAVIEVTGPGDISIIDLGSTKGTFVNGQKINKARIQTGDQILVGETRIEVAIGGKDDEDEAPTRVQPPLTSPSRSPTAVPSLRPPSAPPSRPAAPSPAMRAPAAPIAAPAAARPLAPPSGMPAPAPQPGPAGRMSPAGAAPGMPPMAAPGVGVGPVDETGGARAVEVAAMLGDSVVNVRHLLDPRSGKITKLTYGLFAGGIVLFLMASIAFGLALNNASFNRKAKEMHLASNEPLYDWRPRRISLVFDFMAFGGFAGGMVAVTMGLIRLRNEKESPYFRIGWEPQVEFPFSDAPGGAFPLVAPLGNKFVFNFAPGMDGEASVEGQTVPLAQLQSTGKVRQSSTATGAMEMLIEAKTRIKVRLGKNTFLISSVPRPRRQAAPLFASTDSRMLTYLGGTAVVLLGFMALLSLIPPDPRALTLNMAGAEGRLTRVQSKAQEEPKEEEEEAENNSEASGGTGTAMALDEGKMGKKDSERKSGQHAIKNQGVDPQLAKAAAVDQARSAGVLGVMSSMSGGAFASLTGTGDISSGLDDYNVQGGLMGDEVGEMAGGFGFGRSGGGPGGGGTGMGTVGTGRYGTIGHGSGTGSGYGAGSGRGGLRSRKAIAPQVRIGNSAVQGDLDKNIIRRYIRRQLPRIKYCYEKQLLVKPGLSGDVITQFQISPQGSVLSSTANGVHSEVSNCVADVIKSIVFPKPKGGGLVKVKYPFTFRPTGG